MFGLNIAVLSFLKCFGQIIVLFQDLLQNTPLYYNLRQFYSVQVATTVLLQFTSAWLLEFSTTVITFYDRYYNLRHYHNPRLPGPHEHEIISFPPQCEKSS